MEYSDAFSGFAPGLRETLDEQRVTARDQIAAAWQLHVTRLEEQLASGWKEHLEQVIEERFQETAGRVEESFTREMEAQLADSRLRIRREFGDRFNQWLRRLSKSETVGEMHANLLEASSAFCQKAAVLAVEDQVLRSDGACDFAAGSGDTLGETVIALAAAPALASAVQGADTVIAACSAAEISGELADFFGEAPHEKVGVFPIVARGKTLGLLCASWREQEPGISGLELLTMLAGLVVEVRQPPAPSQVVRIAVPESGPSQAPALDRLLHLRAQRFARARVAEMRLYKAAKVRSGRAQADLYVELKADIDAARQAFQTDFVAGCASMVDYVHLEMVNTLANQDASLLGAGYPGPLV